MPATARLEIRHTAVRQDISAVSRQAVKLFVNAVFFRPVPGFHIIVTRADAEKLAWRTVQHASSGVPWVPIEPPGEDDFL